MNPLVQQILFNRYTLMLAILLAVLLAFAGLRGCACLSQAVQEDDHAKTDSISVPSPSDYNSRRLPVSGGPDSRTKK
jgi:hypothetical protein